MNHIQPDTLLDFWFGELQDGLAGDAQRAMWFNASDDFDQACHTYEPALQLARAGALADWLNTTPTSLLAFVILCDQLPRNIYRGTSQAYAYDDLALQAAKQAVQTGADRALGWDQRAFLYMPFEHSESLLDQHTAVGLFSALRDQSQGAVKNIMGNNLRYAQQHRDIILKFGRFPHRNEVLGRASSEAEAAFVSAGSGFGQAPRDNQTV